jgi:hypothetical protein
VLNHNDFGVPGSEMFALKEQIRVSHVTLEPSLPNAMLQIVPPPLRILVTVLQSIVNAVLRDFSAAARMVKKLVNCLEWRSCRAANALGNCLEWRRSRAATALGNGYEGRRS